jgi:glutamate/tyrosine decarboxylase-like PLP-dependent enzyme
MPEPMMRGMPNSPTTPDRPRHHDGALLQDAARRAGAFLDGLDGRRVGPRGGVDELRGLLAGPLPEDGEAAAAVIARLDEAAALGTMANAGPRFFGFVIGGVHPVALAADWLTSTWDQNAGLCALSPMVAVAEETAARWVLDLLGLPSGASVGFVTGGQMANFTALAAARHEVLHRLGWDVNARGLGGAPSIAVVAGAEAHVTVHRALRYLGIGTDALRVVATDDEGRMRLDELERVLAGCAGPTIVCAQAGDVNSGAFDRFEEVAALCRARSAWLHVDGAFGLWAAAAPGRRHLTRGVEAADSWAVDAHKWLNVPQDCGLAIVARPAAHHAALSANAAYLIKAEGRGRDAVDWTPEFSRRARSLTVHAVLRQLGRRGVADLVERCCSLARRMAERLAAEPGVEVLNEVVLNQALVRFGGDGEAGDALTRAVVARVQREGSCWLGGTSWRGRAAMRISVINWSTTAADIDASAAAILGCLAEERRARAE